MRKIRVRVCSYYMMHLTPYLGFFFFNVHGSVSKVVLD